MCHAVEVNSLSSFDTELPYEYYSMPFCKPEVGVKKSTSSVNPGTILSGLRMYNSPYSFSMQVRVTVCMRTDLPQAVNVHDANALAASSKTRTVSLPWHTVLVMCLPMCLPERHNAHLAAAHSCGSTLITAVLQLEDTRSASPLPAASGMLQAAHPLVTMSRRHSPRCHVCAEGRDFQAGVSGFGILRSSQGT